MRRERHLSAAARTTPVCRYPGNDGLFLSPVASDYCDGLIIIAPSHRSFIPSSTNLHLSRTILTSAQVFA